MPFVFLIVGIGLLVTAIRGTQATAFGLLESEFSGPNSFLKWALAMLILGAAGYIPVIRPVTRGLMVLVLLAIVLKNKGGLFKSFNDQIAAPVQPPAPPASAGVGGASAAGSGALTGAAAVGAGAVGGMAPAIGAIAGGASAASVGAQTIPGYVGQGIDGIYDAFGSF